MFLQGPWFLILLWCPNLISLWVWCMQKLAATSKIIDKDTRTVFVWHMPDLFLKKLMIKRNTLIIVCIKKHTHYRYYKLFKQISAKITMKFLNSCSEWQLLINRGGWVGLSETGVVVWRGGGGKYSVSCSASISIKFSVTDPIWKALNVEGEKMYLYLV